MNSPAHTNNSERTRSSHKQLGKEPVAHTNNSEKNLELTQTTQKRTWSSHKTTRKRTKSSHKQLGKEPGAHTNNSEKNLELTPNVLEHKAGSGEQWMSGSTCTGSTSSSPRARWSKERAREATLKQVDDPSNHGRAKHRRWRCSGDGELWPRRRARDGGTVGREEEEQQTGVPDEIK